MAVNDSILPCGGAREVSRLRSPAHTRRRARARACAARQADPPRSVAASVGAPCDVPLELVCTARMRSTRATASATVASGRLGASAPSHLSPSCSKIHSRMRAAITSRRYLRDNRNAEVSTARGPPHSEAKHAPVGHRRRRRRDLVHVPLAFRLCVCSRWPLACPFAPAATRPTIEHARDLAEVQPLVRLLVDVLEDGLHLLTGLRTRTQDAPKGSTRTVSRHVGGRGTRAAKRPRGSSPRGAQSSPSPRASARTVAPPWAGGPD
jgi:hypothetical protein